MLGRDAVLTRRPWTPVYPKVRQSSYVQSLATVPPWTRGGEMMKNIGAKNLGQPRRRPLQAGYEYSLPALLRPVHEPEYVVPPVPRSYRAVEEARQKRVQARMGVNTVSPIRIRTFCCSLLTRACSNLDSVRSTRARSRPRPSRGAASAGCPRTRRGAAAPSAGVTLRTVNLWSRAASLPHFSSSENSHGSILSWRRPRH